MARKREATKSDQWPITIRIEFVPLNRLDVNDEYQRGELPKHIKEIAKNFSHESFGAIHVHPSRGGRFAILDGQQRAAAAREVGCEVVPCLVCVNGRKRRSIANEAKIFTDINARRRQPKQLELFKSRLAMNEKQAVEIKAIVESIGFVVTNGNAEGTAIGCVGALDEIYNTCGPGHLQTTLESIAMTWPNQPDGLKRRMILGLSEFIEDPRIRGFKVSKIPERCGRQDVTQITYLANKICGEIGADGRAVVRSMTRALRKVYAKR